MEKEQYLSPLRTYDISFDQNQAKELSLNEDLIQNERFSSYISKQMETHLGERFNVEVSRYSYDMRDGLLWGKDMDEPFIESMSRGRNFRRENGNPVDYTREDAEVVGFEKIQQVLTDPKTPIGTSMLSVSPPGSEGSAYKHNFYDIFALNINDEGEKYVNTRRYASSLSIEEYKEKLKVFGNLDIEEGDPSASFIKNPIKIPSGLNDKDLHYYLQKERSFMSEEIFELIKNQCKGVVEEFAKQLIADPHNDSLHKKFYNTILNKADFIKSKIENEGIDALNKIVPVRTSYKIYEDVSLYGAQPVREVTTGCGLSGGYEVAQEKMNSPFSVLSFGKDKYGERTFNCPECKKENVRPHNTLLPRCLHCKTTKVAC